jgi:ATP-dependent Clp protease ATP-binding subunit ClpA
VTPADDPGEVDQIIRDGVEQHFMKIARPELFGRMAKGIVVLSFIGEEAAQQIVTKSLHSFRQQLDQSRPGAVLELADDAEAALMAYAAAPDLSDLPCLRRYGGRRIQDMVESLVMDPAVEALVEAGSLSEPRVFGRLLEARPGYAPVLEFSLV